MDALLDMGLRNAVMATVLAVLAASIGAICRRPAVIHGLWLLVLLKLLTPPVLSFPLPWRGLVEASILQPTSIAYDFKTNGTAASEYAIRASPEVSQNDMPLQALFAESTSPSPVNERDDYPPGVLAESGATLSEQVADSPTIDSALSVIPWRGLIVGVWLTGSVLWFGLTIVRMHRFHRLLAFAHQAPGSLREQTERLAARLGLRRCPDVWLLTGRVSPLVWPLGRSPRLFLPIDLWCDLDEEQRATLLVHELAHLARRDSWVRGLELVVMALYWWHPVVWWACRELHEAEEQCCDAWVTWAFPQAARSYALTLMKTVDFLSETRSTLPAVASGIGHVRHLRRRLTMIMRGTTARTMSSAGRLGMLALGAFFLPLLPSWAQDDPGRGREQQERQQFERKVQAQRATAEAQEELARSKAQVAQLEAQVAQAKAQLEAATAQLKLAHERLMKTEAVTRMRLADADALPLAAAQRARSATQALSRDTEHRLQDVEKKLDAVLEELQSLRREIRRGTSPMPPGAAGVPMRGAPGETRPPARRPGGADEPGQPADPSATRPANRRERSPDVPDQPARTSQPNRPRGTSSTPNIPQTPEARR
jgi:beta-lactamase regulating signal transducer with metallopeptidase domain